MSAVISLTDGAGEFKVEGSRFIYFSYFVENEEKVAEIITRLKKQYYDATHVCYAYIIDKDCRKAVDDNEPSGSSGKPILAALQYGGYEKSLIAVVRYFGGTKLGIGGLSRAYSAAANGAVEKSKIIREVEVSVFQLNTDFKTFQRLKNFSLLQNLVKMEVEFSEVVSVVAYSLARDFSELLTVNTNGRVKANYIGQKTLRVNDENKCII